ncbi:TIGR02680 family protein [Pseudonocardiaceae bacterium YIM PH 21723]|nr:TIGR02680 family protein [Pseudonocardiaceae bacterium YIM PH 21723]
MSTRWRLNRGGIVNIWQYAEQTFDFSGGRAIFQGTNGSGKSRTLELLLPLCLDGELRQLGSKGFDTVSIRRLMLDDYQGGPNRIGYAWIELIRTLPDGTDEYLTSGIGVKASKTAQQITDSWRFVTPGRVNTDFALAAADRVPLSAPQLRDVLGADCVLEDAAFRAKIADVVYGLPSARYSDLLHLQRTLRNPDVGLKVLEGQLEQILSDALPPLDAALIEQLAGSFDDLESIRENITRLSKADTAMSAFLSSYTGYALSALRTAAGRMSGADGSLKALESELESLATKQESGRAKRTDAEQRVRELEAEQDTLEGQIEALKELPAYRGMRDLQDRERLVASARAAAESALDVAARQRGQEDRAVDSVLTVVQRLETDLQAALAIGGKLRHSAGLAGVDPSLCPQLPTLSATEARTVTEEVLAKPEPDAEPVAVERRVPPQLAADALAEALKNSAQQVSKVAKAARQRSGLALSLYQQAVQADKEQRRIEELRLTAREVQIAATESQGRRNEAGQQLSDAASVWLEYAARWLREGPLEGLPEDRLPALPTVDALTGDRGTARTARNSLRQLVTPEIDSLRQQAVLIEQRIAEHAESFHGTETEMRELSGGQDRVPARAAYSTADRDPATGAPFYRLVEFADGLTDAQRAGLEAALEASGLLDAWVTSTGTIDNPELADIFATPAQVTPRHPLSRHLSPAIGSSPVPADVITGILNAIESPERGSQAAEAGESHVQVALDGSWTAGVLQGKWAKEAAEFVGAGARQAATARRMAELQSEQEALGERQAGAQRELDELHRLIARWQEHLDAFPDDGELISAHARLANAFDTAKDASQKAERLRSEHRKVSERFQAVHAELIQTATASGLPTEAEALEQARRGADEVSSNAEQLREALEDRCTGTVSHLTGAATHYRAAVNDREAAEAAAQGKCADYHQQQATLDGLVGAVGSEAEDISRQLSIMEQRRIALRTDLPQAREKVATTREQASKVDTLLETKQAQLSGRRGDTAKAAEEFQSALSAPGIWSAAIAEERPADMASAIAAIEALEDKRGSTEATVITKLQALQTALSGSHDIVAEQHAGILTVTVSSEDGPRPLADAARLVSSRLQEQRGYLGTRYQDIFAAYLIRDLADRLRTQMDVAEDLCRRMNDVLAQAESSQGVHVQLEWRPSAALDDNTRQALELVRMPLSERTTAQDDLLRQVFTERIEAERDTQTSGYAEILSRALDYRTWYSFTVRVRDTGPDSQPRVRRLRQLSSGETRLVSYVTLFAAAASFYDAVSDVETDEQSSQLAPLRLVLLDEAFERLDDPTIARMLGLLVDLDMDWIITWPSGWGVSPKIPRMHIYDVLRPKNGQGVACTHTTWDGAALDRDDP